MRTKYEFYQDIIGETKQPDDETGEATIAQEITNGLAFEIVSDTIQMIEDLFALISAGRKPYYFPKNIITYSTGKIYNLISKKLNDEELCTLFYFPFFTEKLEDEITNELYLSCIIRLQLYIKSIRDFFITNEFFYTQYKHGLTVAQRFHSKYSEELVVKDKEDPTHIYIAAFDNLSIAKLKMEDTRVNKMMLMPHLTPAISNNLPQLLNEDNLIRFVVPQDELKLEAIIDIAYKTRDCINMFSNNLVRTVQQNGTSILLQIPEGTRGMAYNIEFQTQLLSQAKNAKIFSIEHCS